MGRVMQKEIREQLDVFARYLRRNGLKMTRQRETLVDTFLKADGHLSAEELFELAKRVDSRLGYATVFRTLKALTECGLAREIDFADGRHRFEKTYRRPDHHHIVCQECQRTIEFFSPELQEIEEEIVREYHLKPVRQRLQIFGICEDCQKKRRTRHEVYDNDLVFARDALKIALETEKRGINFYRTAADNSTHPNTRGAFLSMLEEEQHHYDQLAEEWAQLIGKHPKILEAPVFLHFDFEALQKIFPSRRLVRRKMAENLSEIEALRLAMSMELEAYNFFTQYAEKFKDTKGRDIFLKFAQEEQEHYHLIKTELEKLLADSGS